MHTFLRCLALGAAALLGACGGGSLSTDQGEMRFINATSGATTLDLFADNRAVATGVPANTSSGYARLDQDNYTLDIRQTGNAATLFTTSTTLSRRKHQTVVAYTNAGTMTATVLNDEEGEPGSGKAKFRVFNTLTADTDKVDVYLVAAACNTLEGSAAAATAVGVSGLQSTYTELASSATTYHLCVTGANDRSDLRLDIPSIVLSEKRIVTVVLARGTGGFLLNGIVVDQQGAANAALNASARVRIAASLEPAAASSVTVNGIVVSAGLGTPGVSQYKVIPAGVLAVTVNGAAVSTSLTAVSGADHTLLVNGPVGAPALTLVADDNTPSTSTAKPVRIRLVNGLNVTAGDATLSIDDVPLDVAVGPRTASPYTTVAANSTSTTSRIEARLGATQLFVADRALVAGKVYSVFVLGTPATAPNGGRFVADR
jgi:hypothetical protein